MTQGRKAPARRRTQFELGYLAGYRTAKVVARARIEAARDHLHADRVNMTDWQEVALNEAEAHGMDRALELLDPPEAT